MAEDFSGWTPAQLAGLKKAADHFSGAGYKGKLKQKVSTERLVALQKAKTKLAMTRSNASKMGPQVGEKPRESTVRANADKYGPQVPKKKAVAKKMSSKVSKNTRTGNM